MKNAVISYTNNEAMLRMAKEQRPKCSCQFLVVHDYWDARYYFHTLACHSLKEPREESLSTASFVWSSNMQLE